MSQEREASGKFSRTDMPKESFEQAGRMFHGFICSCTDPRVNMAMWTNHWFNVSRDQEHLMDLRS